MGHELENLRCHTDIAHVQLGHTGLDTEEIHEDFFGDVAQGHQVATESSPGDLLVSDGTLELGRSNESALNEQFTQPLVWLEHVGS